MNITYKIAIAALGAVGAGLIIFRRKVGQTVVDSATSIRNVIKPADTEASLRNQVVLAAASQLGKKDPAPYWINTTGIAQSPKLSWCGAFALWSLHQAGLALDKNWIIGKGFLLTPPALPSTKTPKPGDIAYYEHFQHHAVVAGVRPDGTIDLINGNGTNASVSPSNTQASKVTAFYSIQPFIDQRLRQHV